MEWYHWAILPFALLFCIGSVVLFHYWAIKPLVKKQVSKWHILVALILGVFVYFTVTWLIKDLPVGNIAAQELFDIMPIAIAYSGGLMHLILRGQ